VAWTLKRVLEGCDKRKGRGGEIGGRKRGEGWTGGIRGGGKREGEEEEEKEGKDKGEEGEEKKEG
jgi:hypothetical protein